MLERELIAEGCFASSGTATNEIRVTCQQPTIQQAVESLDAGSQPGMFSVAADTDHTVWHGGKLDRERRVLRNLMN